MPHFRRGSHGRVNFDLIEPDDALRMVLDAGFTDVTVTQLPTKYFRMQLFRGVKPA